MIVEVDGLLDEPQAEPAEREVEVVLCVVDGRGDVVQTQNGHPLFYADDHRVGADEMLDSAQGPLLQSTA